jgi:hypothetical protein
LLFSVQILLFFLQSKSVKVRTVIYPVVLYVSATWSLILREGNRMRVFEKRALRRMLGTKAEEVTGG